jgi:hypothetical protein
LVRLHSSIPCPVQRYVADINSSPLQESGKPLFKPISLTRIAVSEAEERHQLLQFLLLTRASVYVHLCARLLAAHDRRMHALLLARESARDAADDIAELELGLRALARRLPAAGLQDTAGECGAPAAAATPEPPPNARGRGDSDEEPVDAVGRRVAPAAARRRLDSLRAAAARSQERVLAAVKDAAGIGGAERMAAALREACELAEEVGRAQERLRRSARVTFDDSDAGGDSDVEPAGRD